MPSRILVVDDHDVVRKGIRKLLALRPDWVVCGEASNGLEAIEQAKVLRPDVVVMDISMPKMDGVQAGRIIRREVPESEVIVVSQNDPTIGSRQAAEIDARAYVSKGAMARDLIPAVESALSRRDGRKSNDSKSGTKQAYEDELRILERVGESLASDLDLKSIVQAATDVGRDLSGAGFGAFFYNVLDEKGQSYMLYTLSGAAPEDFAKFPMPRNTCVFAPTFNGEATLRLGDVTKDERYGKSAPYHGMPPGHLPVRSYLAVPVVSRSGAVLGGLFYGHSQEGVFTERAERLVEGIARHAAIAIDNARLFDEAERARAEATAIAERLRLAQQAARVGSFEWNIKTGKNHWTTELEAMYGLPSGGFAGTQSAWEQLIHPHDRVAFARRENEALQSGNFEGEWRVVWPDGSIRWILGRGVVIKNPAGEPERLVGINIDISERKRAEQSGNLLAAIVDSSDDAIISKSLDGIITSWNKSAERLFGYAPEEAIGQHIFLIIPEDRRDEEKQIIERLKRAERVDHFHTQRRCKDGTLLDLSLTISPVKDATGEVIGASKVARDISEAKRTERALRESEERLRILSDHLEMQVQSRTQELEVRNAEVLQQAEQLRELSNRLFMTQDNERRHIARELHDSAGQLITALGMSLASTNEFAKQNPTLEKALADCKELVQQLNDEVRTTSYLLHPPMLDETGLAHAIDWYMQGVTERSGLQISFDISKDFGRLSADMELTLFRIVQEALTNIHRHSGSQTATIHLSRTPHRVCLQISDQGKGIPSDKLAAINSQRSGVGITGMRERIRHLNGKMEISSNGSGTTVSVTLPLDPTVIPLGEETILQPGEPAEIRP